jgi:RNA polymerase sigma-70 factor (ECF subfamily)
MTDDMKETRLLVQCESRSRRRELLGDFFLQHRPRLRRMVELRLDRRLSRRLDPSDVVQEAYLEACRRLEEYLADPLMPLFPWLRRIAGQKLIDLHRLHLGAGGRDARREVSIHEQAGPEASTAVLARQLVARAPSPSETAMREEVRVRIRDLLDKMNPVDREVLALRHFEELSNAEAAQVLGIGSSATSKRHARALRHLRAILKPWYGAEGKST